MIYGNKNIKIRINNSEAIITDGVNITNKSSSYLLKDFGDYFFERVNGRRYI